MCRFPLSMTTLQSLLTLLDCCVKSISKHANSLTPAAAKQIANFPGTIPDLSVYVSRTTLS